ncbi:uncharacterized protein [Diadema antillarum]|uniref:uncharacterized protein n=1 Tax=Diadema antillarum TaxID=105358 RepID=UPI003A87BAFF
MSRHRNIRGRNFDEDYEGYDDVYGHSVEDDYGVSPGTAEQFLYHGKRHELSSYLEDIGEDDGDSDSEQPLADSRNYERPKLSDMDEARLQSCLEEIRNVVGDTTPEHILIDTIVANKFNCEHALDAILNRQEASQRKPKAATPSRSDPTRVSPRKRGAKGMPPVRLVKPRGLLAEGRGEVRGGSTQREEGVLSSLPGTTNRGYSLQSVSRKENTQQTSQMDSAAAQKPSKSFHSTSGLTSYQTHSPQTTGAPFGLQGGLPSNGCSVQVKNDNTMQFLPRGMQMNSKDLSKVDLPMQMAGKSLAELASKHKSDAVEGGKTSSTSGFSLSDLASSHLDGSQSVKLGLQESPFMMNNQKPGPQTNKLLGISLADMVADSSKPHKSSSGAAPSPHSGNISIACAMQDRTSSPLGFLQQKTLEGNAQKNMTQPSLADLFSGHLSSSPKSTMSGSPKKSVTEPGGKATACSSFSLADLPSSTDCGSSDQVTGSGYAGKVGKRPAGKVGDPAVMSLSDLSSSPSNSGSESFISTTPPEGCKIVPNCSSSGSSTYPSSLPEKLCSAGNVKPKAARRSPPTKPKRVSNLAAPSIFGSALCHRCREVSDEVAAVGQGRVGYQGVKRRVLHKQLSFTRQKSLQDTTGVEDRDWEGRIHFFTFSTPSPDDIVMAKQRGALVSPPERTSRKDHPVDPAPRLQMAQGVDEMTSQVTRLSFMGKDAKQGFEVTVEDTSKGRGEASREGGAVGGAVGGAGAGPGSGGGAGEGEVKVGGAEARKGALSPTRLAETSNSRRSSRESIPNVSSEPDLQAYASATSTPSKKDGRKVSTIDIAKELEQRQGGKELLNLVVIGHVDAGKSTLMGHLLYLLGQVNQRVMHKYETESRKQGKASFAYAWVLDETGEERERGITMDVGLTRFETTHRLVTLLDAPGHKDFIPNMITGAAQADAAILVVDATRGEFETGFESGGQTREHALLVRSLGVRQLLVGVNKLDTVSWSEERFREIVKKLGSFLKQAGFKDSDIEYIPCSGLTGENLTEKAKEPNLTSWYSGTCLLEHIDKLKPPKRSIDRSLRLCVSDVFKGMGSGVSVSGKVETGYLQTGEKIIVMPAGENGLIKGISVHDEDARWACAGDHTTIVVTGVDQMNLTIGSVICNYQDPIKATTRFQARVVIFNIEVPLTKGFPVLVHYQSVSETAVIKRLLSILHKSTGEVIQKKPKCLTKHMNAIIEIETSRPVCLELYKDYKELGRFMLRYGGSTIAAGVITELKN